MAKQAKLTEEKINEKFEEERCRQQKSLNICIRGLSTGDNPLNMVQYLISSMLKLPNIHIVHAWPTKDSSLIAYFPLVEHKLYVLWAKKTLLALPNRIFIDEDLTWM